MAKKNASHHLLFGILAFQNGCIDEDQFLSAVRKWMRDKHASIEQLLVEAKALSSKDREMLIPMVQRHMEDHGGDASVSLAATNVFATVRQDLENLEDEDVDEVLIRVSQTLASQEFDPLHTEVTPSATPTYDASQRFRILRPFSAGGMGVVHVAEDTEIGDREVAFKGIRDKYADDPLSRQQFRVEAEITGGLEHPNIVPVYGLGADKTGRPFYAMRFIRGESMKDAIRDYYNAAPTIAWAREAEREHNSTEQRRRYRFRRLLEKFIDVCEAIHYAHCRGVLHRDLKPGNVMLGRYNEVLVVDWGLAVFQPRDDDSRQDTDEPTLHAPSADDKTGPRKGRPEGTPAYMAPEQATGRVDQFGRHTDVYALGATLYCILTGSPPFATGSELKTTLSKVELGDFPRPTVVAPGVSKPLEAICLKAMATRPRDRYQSAQEILAKDVQRWLDDEAVSAWQEPLSTKVARWMRHHQKTVAGITAAIGVGLLAVGIGWMLAEAAEQREIALKEEAIDNYHVARNAVDQFYTQVSEEGLLSQPGMETKREELLKSAQTAYAEFAKNYGNDAAEEYARTLYRLGYITNDLEGPAQAIQHYTSALRTEVQLLSNNAQEPTAQAPLNELISQAANLSDKKLASSANRELRFDISNTLNAIGRATSRSGDVATADLAFQAALAYRELLAAEDASPRNQRKLANTLMNLANLKRDAKDTSDALNNIRRSNKIRQQVTFDDYDWQRDLAMGLANEGFLLATSAKNESDQQESIRQSKSAVEIADRLLAAPSNTELEAMRAKLVQYLRSTMKITGDRAAARQLTTAEIDRAKRLHEASPRVPEFATMLVGYFIDLGNDQYADLLDGKNDMQSIRRNYTEAIELLTAYDITDMHRDQLNLANALKALAKIDDREDQVDSSRERIGQSITMLNGLIEKDGPNPKYQTALQDAEAFRQKMQGRHLLRDGKSDEAMQSLTAAIESYERLLESKDSKFKRWQLEDCKRLQADARSR